MRERVEDLGKLSVLLREVLKSEVFDLPVRPKEMVRWVYPEIEVSEEKSEYIRKLSYQIEKLQFDLADCLYIAKGDEYSNN